MADERIPVYVVTGFLGAGKTTLLRRALKEPEFAGSLLLVNEVAELGVDDRLIRLDGSEAVLLANGCLCCAASDELSSTLHRIVDSAALGAVRRIVIETTGLADPLPVISTIAVSPYLAVRLRVEMVVTLVDVLHTRERSAGSADYLRQIQAADVVLLSKTDMATSEQVQHALDMVAQHNPLGICRIASECGLAELLGEPPAQRADLLAAGMFTGLTAPRDATARTRMLVGGRATTPGHHALRTRTFCLELNEALDWVRFSLWLSLLLQAHGDDILRVKGFLSLENRDAPVVINGVHHVIHFPEHLEEWPDADRRSFLAFIVQDLSPDLVLRSMLACVR